MKERPYFEIKFYVDDLLMIKPHLTYKQAIKVFKFTKKHFDPTIGIKWDAIETASEILFPST